MCIHKSYKVTPLVFPSEARDLPAVAEIFERYDSFGFNCHKRSNWPSDLALHRLGHRINYVSAIFSRLSRFYNSVQKYVIASVSEATQIDASLNSCTGLLHYVRNDDKFSSFLKIAKLEFFKSFFIG